MALVSVRCSGIAGRRTRSAQRGSSMIFATCSAIVAIATSAPGAPISISPKRQAARAEPDRNGNDRAAKCRERDDEARIAGLHPRRCDVGSGRKNKRIEMSGRCPKTVARRIESGVRIAVGRIVDRPSAGQGLAQSGAHVGIVLKAGMRASDFVLDHRLMPAADLGERHG